MSAEPSDSKNPVLSLIGNGFLILVPFALIVMLGVVGANFVASIGRLPVPVETIAAPTPGGGAAGIDTSVIAIGKTAYMTCLACHGPDGTGLKVGPALMAPSLVGSEILLGDPDRPLLVVLKGLAKEDMKFMGVMAPLGAALDDEKLAAVLTYVRNEWGNSAPAVTVEQAAAARAKFGAVDAPAGIKRAEIDQIVAAHK